MSKVEQIEAELCQIRNWLDDPLEDELEFTPEFEASIQKSEREKADGALPRVREV